MNRITFTNTRLVKESGIIEGKDVKVEKGIITDIYQAGERKPEGMVINGNGHYLSPGFIDIHVHGGGGGDFMDGTKDSFEKALNMHLNHGTTSVAPTTLTSTLEELESVFNTYKELKSSHNPTLPHLLGVHLEGPYLSQAMKGAQDERYIRNHVDDEYKKIFDLASGNLLIWTVAPEIEGVPELCAKLNKQGIYFSAGHSQAQFSHMLKAVENGLTMATHLYSGMSTIVREDGFRKLGVIESSLLIDDVCVEIIADGKHLPAELVKLVLKVKGTDKTMLVTDAMRAAGMPEGEYLLGSMANGQKCYVSDNIARMPDGSGFAGSVATADMMIRFMINSVSVPLHEAIKMMTVVPAREIGMLSRKGSIDVGKDADIIIFDEDINIKSVFVSGKPVKHMSNDIT